MNDRDAWKYDPHRVAAARAGVYTRRITDGLKLAIEPFVTAINQLIEGVTNMLRQDIKPKDMLQLTQMPTHYPIEETVTFIDWADGVSVPSEERIQIVCGCNQAMGFPWGFGVHR